MMRETSSSIAVYLLLAGVVGALLHMAELQKLQADAMGKLFSMVGLGVSVIYAYAGIRCTNLIRKHPQRLLYVLALGGLHVVLQLSVLYFVTAADDVPLAATPQGKAVLIRCGVSAAILIYLTINILRLAAEHRRSEQADDLVLQAGDADLGVLGDSNEANASGQSDK